MASGTARERKSKFTASVKQRLVALVDKKAAKLKISRSEVVEEAMEMWLRSQAESEEAAYFESAAAEMNEDARSWNAVTTASVRHGWK
jgi:metal-responsive CopG/Arc/MetJ family transcriptional regulator